MRKKELISLVKYGSFDNVGNTMEKKIVPCRIIDMQSHSITFAVDEGLSKPARHLKKIIGDEIISGYLEDKKIDQDLYGVIDSSIQGEKLATIGSDVLFKCILSCFAEHRPLVLSPDMIWLIINQNLSSHINRHPEKYRNRIVDHDGKYELIVQCKEDILTEKADWDKIFEIFHSQIMNMTKGSLAETMTCDFSTTGPDERIASVITLMDAVKNYFDFTVVQCICGIPQITLKGAPEDWRSVREKAGILKKYGLGTWLEWLDPILSEFIEASEGRPNAAFWKSIVMKVRPEDFEISRGCIPDMTQLTGWFLALFPFRDGERLRLDSCYKNESMEDEIVRVGFKYVREHPNGDCEMFPMELWAGFLGVEEDRRTYALTPRIGWFVRQSREEEEILRRLKAMDEYSGIRINGTEIPLYLRKLDHIKELVIDMEGEILLPDWLDEIGIETMVFCHSIPKEEKERIRQRFVKTNITFYDDND